MLLLAGIGAGMLWNDNTPPITLPDPVSPLHTPNSSHVTFPESGHSDLISPMRG